MERRPSRPARLPSSLPPPGCDSVVWLPAWLPTIEKKYVFARLPAPRPRLERGTYCLGRKPVTRPHVAWRGPVAVVIGSPFGSPGSR
jgi:hypothetical protein